MGVGFRLVAEQAVFQTANGLGLFVRETDPVGFLRQSRQQRPIKCGMRAERCGQYLIACIGNLESDVQMRAFDRVSHSQSKCVWKMQTGGLIVRENQGTGFWAALAPLERPIPRKTMLRHRIGFALAAHFVVFKSADDRKQDRRMSRPGRSGLPQQLKPFAVL